MSGNALYNAVRQYLASFYMYADEEWLLGCVEFLTNDNTNHFNETQIKNLAKEQWLLNDLKDICPGSLPANLQKQIKTVLTGRYVLQINAAIDIGTPAYQQYLKLQKVNMENVEATTKFEEKIASHRMIKLFLTDGVQEITGIEYKTMRNLTTDITPGCKILIKGPVDCRRGMLLLTEPNIELLGGEVSEISETNCLAGLLSSKLGLPSIEESEHNTTIHHPSNTTVPLHTEMPPPPDPDHTLKPVAVVTSLQAFNDDIDLDQIAEIEQQLYNWNRPEREQSNKRPCTDENIEPEKKFKPDNRLEDYPDDDIFLNEDEDYLNEIHDQLERDLFGVSTKLNSEIATKEVDTKPVANIKNCKTEVKIPPIIVKNDECSNMITKNTGIVNAIEEPGTSIAKNIKLDTKKPAVVPIKPMKFPINISSEPYVFIKQILDLPKTEKAGRVFIIKAQIMKLLSKLCVGKDGWSLKCALIDGTGTLDVEFTNEVLSDLVGFTPLEIKQLKKEMAAKPELQGKIVEALQKAKDKLQVLNCLIELTILEVPQITRLIPFESTHLELLKKRFQSTGL